MINDQKSSGTPQKPRFYRALGLMSGTSIDGMDAAILETDGHAHVKSLGFAFVPYDAALKGRIRAHFGAEHDVKGVIAALGRDVTRMALAAILEVLTASGFQANDIDIIGFHGQTLTHRPDIQFTWQIGDPAYLVKALGVPVIFNFRANDIAAGGQGAPLLPIYHQALAHRHQWTLPVAVVNIGGVANVTCIGADEGDLIAFDTGPGNALIDDFMMNRTGIPMDKDGAAALRGRAHGALVQNMMDHPYFGLPAPKSLDRNTFLHIAGLDALSVEDGAATLALFTALSIAAGIDLLPHRPLKIWVAGGGRHNRAIMSFIEQQTGIETHPMEDGHLNGQAIEAEGFAYMAVRRFLNLPISFSGTTGVLVPLTGGDLYRV